MKDGLLLEEEDSKDTAYVYEGDRLVSYGGADFVYDVMGNPTTYRNMSCVWEKGRQLKSISDGANTVSFTYDEFGMRTSKTAGGTATNYVYENGKLLREVTGSEKIDFVYGSDGIIGFRTGNKNYLYRKNVFGDVTEIYSDNGTLVGKYSYTAFGECIVKVNEGGIAEKNPIRYRGYYYDEEMSLYYLKSRYYDPITGRFITIDDISYIDPETINGLNLYAYCGNNPVMYTDPNGTAKWWQWFLFGVGAALVVAAAIVLTVASGGAAGGLIGAIAIGAAKGALIGAAVGSAVGIAGGAIYAGVTGADMGQSILSGFLMGFGIGAIAGAVIGGTIGANGWYNAKALEFTNNAGSGKVVLGRSMDGYTSIAKRKNATYFYSDLWESTRAMKGVGNRGMWKINKAFLKQQIKVGSKFYLASNPAIGPEGYFIKEVAYLAKKGILAVLL